ncbi:MAG: MFS transporter [Deltaproteobacteria bacterium]|nr:MFS transporter [Deltaproteobacteria bacterium]
MNPPTNWILLINAMLGNFLAGAALRLFHVAMPTVAADLRADILWVSWAMLSYQISNVGLSLVFGRIGDLFGRQKILVAGYMAMTAGSLVCGLSSTISYLIGFRVLQGAGAAMIQAVSRALAAEAMPEKKGGKAQGLMTTAFHLGVLFGPSIGGFIIDQLGWRWTFYFLVPFGMAGLLLNFLSRTGSARERQQHGTVDYSGATLLMAASTTLTLLLDRRTTELFDPLTKVIVVLLCAVSLVGFLVRESIIPNPLVDLGLFRIRMFAASSLSLLIVATNYSLSAILLPFYLQDVLRLSPSFMGVLFMAAPIFTVTFSPVSGYLSDRVGPRLPATLGVILLILSVYLGSFFRTDSSWILPAVVLALLGLANGFFNPANSVGIIHAVPKADMGIASGTLTLMFSLGNILGIALAGFAMTIFFQAHSGIPAAAPTPQNPVAFVAALNDTFLAATGVGFLAVVLSIMRGTPANQRESAGPSPAKRT